MKRALSLLHWRRVLRRVIGIGLILVPLTGLYLLADSTWQFAAPRLGLNADDPPIALAIVAAFVLGFTNKLPLHSRKTLELSDWCLIDAPADLVWSSIHPGGENANFHPFVTDMEEVSDHPNQYRLKLSYFEGIQKGATRPVVEVRAENPGQWLRVEPVIRAGLPAWDKRLAWCAWNLIEEEGGVRVQLTQAYDKPKFWALPLYRLFRPTKHQLTHLKAFCEQQPRPTTLLDFWVEQYMPNAEYSPETLKDMHGSLEISATAWVVIVSVLFLPMIALIMVLSTYTST